MEFPAYFFGYIISTFFNFEAFSSERKNETKIFHAHFLLIKIENSPFSTKFNVVLQFSWNFSQLFTIFYYSQYFFWYFPQFSFVFLTKLHIKWYKFVRAIILFLFFYFFLSLWKILRGFIFLFSLYYIFFTNKKFSFCLF